MSDHAIAGIRPRNQLVFLLLSLISCVSSVALTINFCWHLRSDSSIFAALMAVSIGIAWECAKYAFAPLGLQLLRSTRPSSILGGLGLLVVTMLLVSGSVVASMGYLLQSDAMSQRRALENSRAYRDTQHQMSLLDGEIALLQRAAKADLTAYYRTRAIGTMAQLQTLRQQRQRIAETLTQLEAPSLSNGTFFGQLATVFEVKITSTANTVRIASYLVVSLMLELISLCAVSVWAFCIVGTNRWTDFDTEGAKGSVQNSVQRWQKINTNIMHSGQQLVGGRADTGTRTGMDTRYKTTKELILSGKIKPTVRAVRHALQISQEPARRFLAQLCGEGILIDIGNNHYQVAS